MSRVKGEHLRVNLGAAQLRRRLHGHGFGVRKIESAGRGQAIVIHTATGEHLRQLRALLADVLPPEQQAESEKTIAGTEQASTQTPRSGTTYQAGATPR